MLLISSALFKSLELLLIGVWDRNYSIHVLEVSLVREHCNKTCKRSKVPLFV